MSECISKQFIKNGILVDNSLFKSDWIYSGAAIYEVFRIIKGVPLFWNEHYDRLLSSASIAEMQVVFNQKEISRMIEDLLVQNEISVGNIKLVYKIHDGSPLLLIYEVAHKYPTAEQYKLGVKTVSLHAERNKPNAKILNQSLRDQTNQIIKSQDIYEVLLLDKNGNITEGSRSNIFMIKDGEIYTPPVANVLPGITRQHVIALCAKLGYRLLERSLPINQVPTLDGLFITGTSPKILPVAAIDSFEFNYESIQLKRLMLAFDELIEAEIRDVAN